MNKPLTQAEKDLIKKFEAPRKKGPKFDKNKKDMYLEQTDRNYKDGDRNWLSQVNIIS